MLSRRSQPWQPESQPSASAKPGAAQISCVPCQGARLSPVETRAGKLSLQPEALGAGREATNGLKHLEKRPLLGVSGPCGPQRE